MIMRVNQMKEVYCEIDKYNLNAAYELLRPMLNNEVAEAQYVYAMYIAHENETAEEYDLRSLKYIQLAAKQSYAPAQYRLGVLYQIGEGVPSDKKKASNLFKLAAESGHGLAKISYAMDLYSGLNGQIKNEQHARNLVSECVKEEIEGASSLLEKWNSIKPCKRNSPSP